MKEKQNETEKIVMIHHEKLIDFALKAKSGC